MQIQTKMKITLTATKQIRQTKDWLKIVSSIRCTPRRLIENGLKYLKTI